MDVPDAKTACERTLKAREGSAYQEQLKKQIEHLEDTLPWRIPNAVRRGEMSLTIMVEDMDLALEALEQSLKGKGYVFIPCKEDTIVISWDVQEPA